MDRQLGTVSFITMVKKTFYTYVQNIKEKTMYLYVFGKHFKIEIKYLLWFENEYVSFQFVISGIS